MNMLRKNRLRSTYTMAWVLVGFLWFSYFLNCCDRQVVYVVFPVLKAQLGFTNAQLGLTGSIFIWTIGFTSPFAGRLSDRYSKQSLLFWALLLWSTVTFVTGLSTSPGMLLTGRAFLGITEAVFVPVAVGLIGSTLPVQFHSRATGLLFSAQLFGVIVGGAVGGWIAEHWGWRTSFFCLGIVGALFAPALAMFLRNIRESRPVARPHTHFHEDFVELARIPSFVALCACFPIFLVVLTVLYAWLPTLLHDKFSLGLADAGFRATVFLAGGTAAGLIAGSYFSDHLYKDRHEARFWLLVASMICGAPWLYFVSHGSLVLTEVGAAGFGVANGVYTANIMVAPFDVVPVRARTTAVAVINTIAPPFSGLAAFLTGVWKQRIGIPGMLMILGALTIIAGVVLLCCTALLFTQDHARLVAEESALQNSDSA